MECINVVIDHSSAVRIIIYNDSDIFESRGSIDGVTSDSELLENVVSVEWPKTKKYEEKETYLCKWAKYTCFADNIISFVKGGVKSRN